MLLASLGSRAPNPWIQAGREVGGEEVLRFATHPAHSTPRDGACGAQKNTETRGVATEGRSWRTQACATHAPTLHNGDG
jgi:hypothetical protein